MKTSDMLANLTPAQHTALRGLLKRFSDRPSYSDYAKAGKALAALPAANPKRIKSIPGAKPGVHGTERWSSPLFKPHSTKPADLPEGLALVSIHDSGDNYALVNAASAVWLRLWNSWNSPVAAYLRACLGEDSTRDSVAGNHS